MAVKYYKKFSPETKVVVASGQGLTFTTLNHLVGYFATDNEGLQKEFETFMRQNRYAITEIPETEFMDDYVKKKASGVTLRPLSREELSGTTRQGFNPVEILGSAAVQAVVGVKTVREEPVTVVDAPPAVVNTGRFSTPTPENGFKPPVGARKRRIA